MTITFEPTYNGHPINTNKEKKQGCDTKILNKIDKTLEYATNKHCKVLGVRFDLRYPKGYHASKDNKDISEFMSKFNKDLKRKKLDPLTIWVREKSREKNQHVHVAVMLDGNKIQFPNKINELATKHWQQTINSTNERLVDRCDKSSERKKQVSSYRLRRGAEDFNEQYDECYHRFSYLAKENTKEKDLNGNRRFGCSILPTS